MNNIWMDRYSKTISAIKKQIGYNDLIVNYDSDIINNIVNIMVDVFLLDGCEYKIEGNKIEKECVQQRFRQITYGNLSAFLIAFQSIYYKIKNPKTYLITALYNVSLTADTALVNQVNYVTLPDTHTLTTSNQTTVTVLDNDSKPVKSISVTVTDKNEKKATKSTNSNGKVKSSGGGGSSSSSGGSVSTTVTYNVKVVDKDEKTISVTKSIKDDKINLTLPGSLVLDESNYYTITVTDKTGAAKANIDVTLKDKNGTESNGTTDKNGQLILPAKEHKLYVVGYEDGEFKPEGNMTRAEAAAIFARNIAERKDENISSRKSSFTDVSSSKWYSKYIAYLEKYDIIEGYNDGMFKPEEQITRAEFVTMCTRFYKMFDEVSTSKKNIFNDVTNNHWASGYICNATEMDWIKGYADGTFRPDNNIQEPRLWLL